MKLRNRYAKDDHVRIGIEIAQAQDFKHYLAISRDSYPMGLGRIAAICLDILLSKKTYYSVFELDRVVQWPADRPLSCAKVFEQIGWGRFETNSIISLELPTHFIPRKPRVQRSAVRTKSEQDPVTGQFVKRTFVKDRGKLKTPIVLLDMDGYPVENSKELEMKESINATARRKPRGSRIVPAASTNQNPL